MAFTPFQPTSSNTLTCRIEPKLRNGKGRAPASGAVFRALAENPVALKRSRHSCQSRAPCAGREARPATPGAGVLPNSGIRIESYDRDCIACLAPERRNTRTPFGLSTVSKAPSSRRTPKRWRCSPTRHLHRTPYGVRWLDTALDTSRLAQRGCLREPDNGAPACSRLKPLYVNETTPVGIQSCGTAAANKPAASRRSGSWRLNAAFRPIPAFAKTLRCGRHPVRLIPWIDVLAVKRLTLAEPLGNQRLE